MANKKISVVVPVCNEQASVPLFYDALIEAVKNLKYEFEFIFVDDGSTDNTFNLLSDLSKRDARVKVLRFSRNFGSHPALSAGLEHSTGDAAVMISVDLQDPPKLISHFIQKWEEGNHVVWGTRVTRNDSWSKKTFANLFYFLIRKLAFPDYPPQGMDCGLIDRQVINAFNHFKEASRIVPTLIVWAGFRQICVPYHREARLQGESKWSMAKRIKAAIDIIVSFSYVPVRFISSLGILVSMISFVYGTFLITRKLFFGYGVGGWPSVMVAILFLSGIQMTMLGVLGEYIWRINEQVKDRPLYILMEKRGF